MWLFVAGRIVSRCAGGCKVHKKCTEEQNVVADAEEGATLKANVCLACSYHHVLWCPPDNSHG